MKPVALDAMGGDFAPKETVAGALLAAEAGIPVVLVGDQERLARELAEHGQSLPIVHAPEAIAMNEHATEVRKKRSASINVAMELVRSGDAVAVASMGHTGATMASALFGLGRIPGIERPAPLATFPSASGKLTHLIDGGANADCRPSFLVQFAILGSAYAKLVSGVPNPSVGLLTIGEEEGKGNELAIRTQQLLKNMPGINYYGPVEGRDIPTGLVDIVVTDGFTGNVVGKAGEGFIRVVLQWVMETLLEGLPEEEALHAVSALRGLKTRLDPDELTASPLLGVNGAVIIGHGNGKARAVQRAIERALSLGEAGYVELVREGVMSLRESL